MKKYNLSEIMGRAWRLYRNGGISFAEALHRSWISAKAQPINAQRIETAKAAAGVVEECKTWADWKRSGYEVRHGSRALFGCELIHGSRGDGATYKASFFGLSQVDALPA